MLQYKIPQDVGIEDKIVGPLSLRQLIIVAVGVGISYVIFAIAGKLYELNTIEYIVIALPAIIAAAAAFIRINNVSFTKFILLSLEYAIKPKKRLWDHRGIAHLVAPDLKEKETGPVAKVAGEKSMKGVNLDELSRILDSGGFENIKVPKHEDIDKVKDEDLMTEAYFGHKKSESPTENMYWRTKESHKKRLDILAKLPPVAKKQEMAVKEAVKTEKTAPQEAKQAPPVISQPTVKLQEQKPQIAKAPEQPEIQKQPQKQPTAPIVPPKIEKPTQAQPVPPEIQPQKAVVKPEALKQQVQKTVTETPIIKPQIQKSVTQGINKPPVIAPKKPQFIPQQRPQTSLSTENMPNQTSGGAKKKRRRNKKSKTLMPVRPETQINNTQKNKPVTLIAKEKTPEVTPLGQKKPDTRQEQPAEKTKNGQTAQKQQQPAPIKEKPVQTDQSGGEIHLEELKKGEITWGF